MRALIFLFTLASLSWGFNGFAQTGNAEGWQNAECPLLLLPREVCLGSECNRGVVETFVLSKNPAELNSANLSEAIGLFSTSQRVIATDLKGNIIAEFRNPIVLPENDGEFRVFTPPDHTDPLARIAPKTRAWSVCPNLDGVDYAGTLILGTALDTHMVTMYELVAGNWSGGIIDSPTSFSWLGEQVFGRAVVATAFELGTHHRNDAKTLVALQDGAIYRCRFNNGEKERPELLGSMINSMSKKGAVQSVYFARPGQAFHVAATTSRGKLVIAEARLDAKKLESGISEEPYFDQSAIGVDPSGAHVFGVFLSHSERKIRTVEWNALTRQFSKTEQVFDQNEAPFRATLVSGGDPSTIVVQGAYPGRDIAFHFHEGYAKSSHYVASKERGRMVGFNSKTVIYRNALGVGFLPRP
jgi:hypothetical protein